jgi:hypothetical protein
MHAVHHSAPRVYWLNVARSHPIESLLEGSRYYARALGAPEYVLFLLAFREMHSVYSTRTSTFVGPVQLAFQHVGVHRWHHSRNIEESNGNYGGTLLLSGRALFPDPRRAQNRESQLDVGLREPAPFPQNYLGRLKRHLFVAASGDALRVRIATKEPSLMVKVRCIRDATSRLCVTTMRAVRSGIAIPERRPQAAR